MDFFDNNRLTFVYFDYHIAVSDNELVYKVEKYANTEEIVYLMKGMKKTTEFFLQKGLSSENKAFFGLNTPKKIF
jgi:hypothetical protein